MSSGLAIASDPDKLAAGAASWLCTAHYGACRAGAFVVLNVRDDPAWLALIFC